MALGGKRREKSVSVLRLLASEGPLADPFTDFDAPCSTAFEDRREISVSHNSTEVEIRLHTSADVALILA
jgi:hypothetical protein